MLRCVIIALSFLGQIAGAQPQPALRVGAVLPLTGPGAFMGHDVRDGLELCAANRLSVVYEDHQSQAAVGLNGFKKLIDGDQINFGLVSFSNVSNAIIPVARARGIPLLLTIVSAGKVAQSGGENVLNYFTTGEQDGPILAHYWSSKLKLKRAAILALEGDFGLSYSTSFSKQFEKDGGMITADETYLPAVGDFRSQLVKIKRSGAEALYIVGYDTYIPSILRQARELNLDMKLGGIWTWTSPPIRQGNDELFEGTFSASPTYYFRESEREAKFTKDFYAQFDRQPTAYAAIGCDMAEMMVQYGGKGPHALMQSLRALKNFDGVMGSLSASADGNIVIPLYPVEIRAGKVVPLDGSPTIK